VRVLSRVCIFRRGCPTGIPDFTPRRIAQFGGHSARGICCERCASDVVGKQVGECVVAAHGDARCASEIIFRDSLSTAGV
jgi:hypothetical protein